MELPDKIRERTRKTREYVRRADEQLKKLLAACKHPHVVILATAYGGSRSMDYDDAQEESRRCLDCGLGETGPLFQQLLAPMKRFEFGGSAFHARLNATPFGHKLLSTPLEQVLGYASKNGYKT